MGRFFGWPYSALQNEILHLASGRYWPRSLISFKVSLQKTPVAFTKVMAKSAICEAPLTALWTTSLFHLKDIFTKKKRHQQKLAHLAKDIQVPRSCLSKRQKEISFGKQIIHASASDSKLAQYTGLKGSLLSSMMLKQHHLETWPNKFWQITKKSVSPEIKAQNGGFYCFDLMFQKIHPPDGLTIASCTTAKGICCRDRQRSNHLTVRYL